ncbi:integral membrane protein [Lactiplantibacillus plantarum]|nr:integral membrane protein [Lactiplantibacillus plantarum]
MLHLIEQLYGPFFSATNWGNVITSANDWLIILSLAIIECLLSVDNAVVLAAQTQSLDNLQEREKSLFYGLWGGLYLSVFNYWDWHVFDQFLGDQSVRCGLPWVLGVSIL